MQQESICPENSIIVHASKYACFAATQSVNFLDSQPYTAT